MPELNENQKQALEDAVAQLQNNTGMVLNNENIQQFKDARQAISDAVKDKNPLIKEYLSMYKDAETRPYTKIGRMVKEMKNVAAKQEVLKIAAELCKEDSDKKKLLQQYEDLNNSPAMVAYRKYIQGLQYYAGMINEIQPEVREFFADELHLPFMEKHGSMILFEAYRKGEEPNLKPFDDEPITPTEKRNIETYQKLVAKAKARELFAFQQINFEPMQKQFLGDTLAEWESKNKGVPEGFTLRGTPTNYCIGRMLMEGYDLEDIMDPRLLQKEKQAIGAEYMDFLSRGDVKPYGNMMYEAAKALKKGFNTYAKRHKDEIKTEQDFAMHAEMLDMLGTACMDLLQELPNAAKHMDRESSVKMNALADEMANYHFATSISHGKPIPYNPLNCSVTDITGIMASQVGLKMMIERIQKDDPDFDKYPIGMMEQADILKQLCALSDIPTILGNKSAIKVDERSEAQIKGMASMVNFDYIKKNDISVEKSRIPLNVTKEIKDSALPISKGEEFKAIVSIKGQTLITTREPLLMGRQLKSLEDAGIRGKEKNNSQEFNALLRSIDEVAEKVDNPNLSNQEYLDELAKLKDVAAQYLNAKRAQKGYGPAQKFPDTIDNQMLGLEKGKSIFTSKGKARYNFALNVVMKIQKLEKGIKDYEKKNASVKKEEKQVIETSTPEVKNEVNSTPKPEVKEEVKTTPTPTPAPKTENENKMDDQLRESDRKMLENEAKMREKLVEWASVDLKLGVNHLGDPVKIKKYMNDHPELTDIQVEHLEERIAANEKIQKYQDTRSLDRKKRPPCIIDGNGKIMLDKKNHVPKQTSRNGCWSCVLSDMLSHFGVDLTQKEIRFYRPEFRPEFINHKESKKMATRLSRDVPNELFDVADLVHRTVPNVAFHHMTLDTTAPDIKDKFLKKIEDILVNHNSPAAVWIKGHYRSIVGMEGDKLIVEDSARSAQQLTYSVNELFRQCGGGPMVVDWLEDLKFTKDGQCKNITEQDKTLGYDCNNGVFASNDLHHYSHIKGNQYMLDGDGYGEIVYTPKMAFEKEMGLAFEDTKEEIDLKDAKEDNLSLDDSRENSAEKQANTEPEVKLSKKEILDDSTALSKDQQMLDFAAAVIQLGKNKYDLGSYDEWDDKLKKKIPMEMLVNDFELGTAEEVSGWSGYALWQALDNQFDRFTYDEAVSKKEEREEELRNQAELENDGDEFCL